MELRIGNGIDCHKLILNERLILGGIKIKSNLGLAGHSDGDIIFHALVDSMLGALALGDIGTFFPSDNDKLEDADSSIFLEFAKVKINKLGFKVHNTDITIILQYPIISDYIFDIRKNVATILNINLDKVSVKATTTDKLGFIGKKKGIVAFVNTLLIKNGN